MDNLKAHKVHGIEKALEKAGAGVVYKSPYSPLSDESEIANSPAMRKKCVLIFGIFTHGLTPVVLC